MTADPLGGLGAPPGRPVQPPPQQHRRWVEPPTPSTRALLALLAVFFVAQSWLGGWDTQDGEALFRLGSLYPAAVLDGDLWRLGSYAFLHIGVAHFVMNAWALWVLMRPVEGLLGPAVSVGIFAGAALAGGTASAVFRVATRDLFVQGAGASGGIFGLFGAQLALWLRLRHRLPPEVARAGLRAMLINLGLNAIIAFGFPVDNAAHLGGLVGGLVLGLLVPIRGLPLRFWHAPAKWLAVASAFILFAMEGAAVARAAHPRPRTLVGPGVTARVPWRLVPVAPGEAVTPGDLGLVALVLLEDRPAAQQGELVRLGSRTWTRARGEGPRKGTELVVLETAEGARRVVVQLYCKLPECMATLDQTADEIAASVRTTGAAPAPAR